ncbi:MAG: thioredoxin [Calditrichia bacterium]
MSKPIELTDNNFEQEVLKSDLPVLVDFWAPWCGPCRIIAPVVSEIAEEYSGKVKVGKLNTDDNPGTAMAYRIMGIPTLGIFVGGKMVDQIVGAVPKSHITEKLNYYAQAASVKN